MARHDDLLVLGLETETCPEIDSIRRAFRRQVVMNHPDNGGDGRKINRLKLARDRLLADTGAGICPVCAGDGGRITRRGIFSLCPKCNGKGYLPDVEV